MKVLVAGGSGFIGKNFLLKTPQSWECLATYNTSRQFPEFLSNQRLNHVRPISVEMRDSNKVERAFKNIDNEFDVCLYTMGNSDIGLSRREPLVDLEYNIHSLLNLIQNVKVKKFIFMSSGSVYEGYKGKVDASLAVNPTLPYSINKLASERFIQYFQEKTNQIDHYLCLRFYGAYGPMEPPRKIYTNLIKVFCNENRNEFTLMGNGKNFIDAMYIDDTIQGLLRMAVSDKGNKVVDFCVGSPLSINELVCEVARTFEIPGFVLCHEGDAAEYTTFYSSPQEMEALFGFRPHITLSEGMLKFRDYLLEGEEPFQN